MNKLETLFIKTNKTILHTIVAGPKNGPLIILLHGFPEFWYGWRHQIDPLINQGYRVIIPDQRGYNLSQKPTTIHNYTINNLRDDIVGIIEFFQREKAVIVGHDWGGLVAWHLASTKPQYIEQLVIINSPHPVIMKQLQCYFPTQWFKSVYLLFFQIPQLPDALFKLNQFQLFEQILKLTSKKGTFSDDEMRKYKSSWAEEGAITSMLNWYRALYKDSINQVVKTKIHLPVLIIWGQEDTFLSLKLAMNSKQFCSNAKLLMIDGTHWIHLEQPEIVNALMCKFLSGNNCT